MVFLLDAHLVFDGRGDSDRPASTARNLCFYYILYIYYTILSCYNTHFFKLATGQPYVVYFSPLFNLITYSRLLMPSRYMTVYRPEIQRTRKA